jgi:predicted Zn-dependent peptidase
VVDGVARRFCGAEGGTAPVRRPPTTPAVGLDVEARPTEQAHVTVAVRGIPRDDPDRYALAVANHILGGGMSSRLFQTIREERGLAYSVYSYPTSYADAGALVVYAGTAPRHAHEVLGMIHDELDRMAADGITQQELQVATGYLEGSTVLGLEDSASRMSRIGKSLLVHDEVVSVDEVVRRYRAVTLADVRRVLERLLGDARRTTAVVGPFTAADFEPRVA